MQGGSGIQVRDSVDWVYPWVSLWGIFLILLTYVERFILNTGNTRIRAKPWTEWRRAKENIVTEWMQSFVVFCSPLNMIRPDILSFYCLDFLTMMHFNLELLPKQINLLFMILFSVYFITTGKETKTPIIYSWHLSGYIFQVDIFQVERKGLTILK